ncbi:cache domain-containing protein [Bacterioplanoides sp.]|uniref:cache domain-containing protein n=1 Tax=Bacterioplanoides sp. TaxID=2066072 RepID=UPI003AFFFEFA
MNITLKAKILLLTVIPLIALTLTITWVTQRQAISLSEQQQSIIKDSLMEGKRRALRDYVNLAMTSIMPILEEMEDNQKLPQHHAEFEIKRILSSLTYGPDGYFFAYDRNGINIVLPAQPDLVGQDLINIQDPNDQFIIQDMLNIAHNGGGFYQYVWHQPSVDQQTNKLSYVLAIPQLGWMMGTGLYLDDIEAEVQQLENKVDSNIRRTFVAASLLLAITLTLVVVVVIIINIHATHLADDRLKELAHRSESFQIIQRRTFARELHDGINQLLVSAKLHLGLVKRKWPEDLDKQHLNKTEELLNLSIQEVRRVSHNLRPILLDDLGLKSAIHGILDGLENQGQVAVKRKVKLPDSRLPDAIEMTVYRLIQEAITNIQKHADATEVRVSVRSNDRFVTVVVEDNGDGFIPREQLNSGIGMMNMRERVELLGGKFTVRSHYKQGTTVRAELVLNPTTAQELDPTPKDLTPQELNFQAGFSEHDSQGQPTHGGDEVDPLSTSDQLTSTQRRESE